MLLTADIFACSCSRAGILKQQRAAEFIFAGRVENISEIVTEERVESTGEKISYKRYEFTFKVTGIYKGRKKWKDFNRSIKIITTGGDADCGSVFYLNKKYLVYSYEADYILDLRLPTQKVSPFMTTNLCTRTKRSSPLTIFEKLILKLT